MNKKSQSTHNKYGCFLMRIRKIKKIINIRKIIVQFIQIIVGTALMAASTVFFLLPNQLSSGGFSGLATITYYLFKIPIRNYGAFFKYSLIYYIIYKKW